MQKLNKLKELREQQGLSQERAAALAGISSLTWRLIEAGKRDPSLRVAQKISKTFDKTIDELFG